MSRHNSLITNNDIRLHHIEHRVYATDSEYANIARNLLKRLTSANINKFDADILRDIAIKLALYLEDAIADAGVWRSFCTEHHRLYGKWMPFGWADDDFELDEVTLESCQFIIWMTIVKNYEPRYINPNTQAVRLFAEIAFAYFDTIFEDTAINEEMLYDLYSERTLSDFIEVRRVLTWLANPQGCYMSDWDVTNDRRTAEIDNLSGQFKHTDPDMIRYAADVWLPFTEKVGPLAMLAKDWYAVMLDTFKEFSLKAEAQKVRDMKYKPYGPNRIIKDAGKRIIFQDINGDCFEVAHSSFGLNFEKREPDDNISESCFVEYDGVWNNSGINVFGKISCPFEDYIQKHKDEEDGHLRAVKRFERFVAEQDGRRLYYFDGIDSLKQWIQDDVLHQDPEPLLRNIPEDMRQSDEIAIFLPTDGDPEFFWGNVTSINDPLNPLFDPEDDFAINLFDNADAIHGECLRYMLEHGFMRDCRFYYGDTIEACHTLFQENIDFLARFYRRAAY